MAGKRDQNIAIKLGFMGYLSFKLFVLDWLIGMLLVNRSELEVFPHYGVHLSSSFLM